MTAAVTVGRDQELEHRADDWITLAKSIRIADQSDYEIASIHLQAIKSLQAEADDTFDPIVKAAHEAHKEALKQKHRICEPLNQAEALIKSVMGRYAQEQKQLQAEEARRQRQAAELLATQAREAELLDAQASGADAEEVQAIASMPLNVPPVIAPAPVAKVAGISNRDAWKFEVSNKLLLDQFIAKNPQFSNLTAPNSVAIGALVRSLRSAANIPGIKVWVETNVATRGGR